MRHLPAYFKVHSDDRLERRGRDLHSKVDVPLFDAMLGCQANVETPRGERMVAVPQGEFIRGERAENARCLVCVTCHLCPLDFVDYEPNSALQQQLTTATTLPFGFVLSGTQIGDMVCLPQGGIAVSDTAGRVTWGDHFFEVRIIVPDASKMSAQERGLVEKLAELIRLRSSLTDNQGSAGLERWW